MGISRWKSTNELGKDGHGKIYIRAFLNMCRRLFSSTVLNISNILVTYFGKNLEKESYKKYVNF